jgi:drug/metabolite transporter (DMT)-like permease
MASTVPESVTPGLADSTTRPGVWLTDLSLVAMALIWGVNFSVVKFGTSLVDPLAYNGLRVAIAAVVLVVVALLRRGPWPSRRTMFTLVGLGVLGNGIYQFFFVEGLARTSASDTALVVAASPAFIALIGRAMGVERISRKGALGICLSMTGIALVGLGSSRPQADQSSSLLGDILVLCGSLTWATYTVLLKPHTERISGFQLAALTMTGGAVPLLLVAWPAMSSAHWSTVPVSGWGALFYSGVFALVIAYYFWYHGVRVIGPTRTAMYSNLQPLIAVLVAWLVLGESPTAWQGVGAASIMTGLLLTRM